MAARSGDDHRRLILLSVLTLFIGKIIMHNEPVLFLEGGREKLFSDPALAR